MMAQGWASRAVLGILAALSVMGGTTIPAAAQAALKVIVFQGVQNLPLFAAEAQGFFIKRGLAVTIENTPNSQALRDGLAQGRYQIAHTAVATPVAMSELP